MFLGRRRLWAAIVPGVAVLAVGWVQRADVLPTPPRVAASARVLPESEHGVPPSEEPAAPDALAVLAPGERALRAEAEVFVRLNAAAAEEKAAREGITVDEIGELTYLGLLAMRIRQWDAVEQQLGYPLPPAIRTEADDLVFASSDVLEATIRTHVARGDPPAVRWASIRDSEDAFVEAYVALVGLDPAGLDAIQNNP